MLGINLNLVLIIFATLALAAGLSFSLQRGGVLYLRIYTLIFATLLALMCGGYALMGFAPVEIANLPRVVGLFGIDAFLVAEFSYLLFDMKIRPSLRPVLVSIGGVFMLLDMFVYGNKNVHLYMRHDGYTTFEIVRISPHIFHYVYIGVVIVTLCAFAFFWVRGMHLRRERVFAARVISANFFSLFAAIPHLLHNELSVKYPTFGFCAGFVLVFFIWYFSAKKQNSAVASVENVSREVFSMIDVPILIFDLAGVINLCNPAAERELHIDTSSESKLPLLRSVFAISDVELMRMAAKARRGDESRLSTSIIADGRKCSIQCSIKLDYTGEPFCIIGALTYLEQKDVRGNE